MRSTPRFRPAWALCAALLLAPALHAAETCTLQKSHVLKQGKKKKVPLQAGDKVTILSTQKTTVKVKAKGQTRVVPQKAFLAVCRADAAVVQVGVMPLSMKGRVRKADKTLLGKWHDQLTAAFEAARPDVTSLKSSGKETNIPYQKKANKKLAPEKKRAGALGATHVVRTEVQKKRGQYTLRVYVIDLARGKAVATAQQRLSKKSKAKWANAVVEELLPALPAPPKAEEPEPAAAAPVAAPDENTDDGDERMARAEPAGAPAPDDTAPDDTAPEATAPDDTAEGEAEDGSFVATTLYSLGAVTGGLGVVSLIGAAGLGSVALMDSFALLPLDNSPLTKNNRSFTMANVTDGLWVTTGVLAAATAALIGSGFFLSPGEEGPEEAPETQTALAGP